MKKVLVAVLVLSVISVAVFAGGQNDEAATLTVWTGFPETESTLKKAVEVFVADNPKVKVEILTFDFTDLQDKALVSIPAGSAADVVVQEMTDMYGFAKAGWLAKAPNDVQSWIKKPGRYVSTAVPIISYKDAIYAMPFQTGGPALFYNKTFFAEAGLKAAPETVEQVHDYAVKLRKMNASGALTRAGYSIRLTGPGGGTQKFSFIAYQFSGKQVIEPGKAPETFHASCEAPGQAEALQWYVSLLHGKDKSDDWGLKHDSEGFAAGDAAMFMRESWVVPFMKDSAPTVDYGVAVQPKGKYWGVLDYVAGLTVPAAGKNAALAWKFTLAVQNEAVMKTLLQESGWIPPRRDVSYEEIFAKEPHFRAFIEQPKGLLTYFEPNLSASHEIWVGVGEIVQEAYRDAALVGNLAGCQAVMKKAADKTNQILKEAKEYGE